MSNIFAETSQCYYQIHRTENHPSSDLIPVSSSTLSLGRTILLNCFGSLSTVLYREDRESISMAQFMRATFQKSCLLKSVRQMALQGVSNIANFIDGYVFPVILRKTFSWLNCYCIYSQYSRTSR